MPPVTYYGDSVLTLFANVQMVFSFASFVLLGVCGLLVIFKMHLLSLILFSVPAQIYIGL